MLTDRDIYLNKLYFLSSSTMLEDKVHGYKNSAMGMGMGWVLKNAPVYTSRA